MMPAISLPLITANLLLNSIQFQLLFNRGIHCAKTIFRELNLKLVGMEANGLNRIIIYISPANQTFISSVWLLASYKLLL